MIRILFRKFLRAITILLAAGLITFLLVHAIPGNPWSNYSDAQPILQQMLIDETMQDTLNRHFGLDLPLWRQYTRYMIGDINPDGSFYCGALCGNLGPSSQRGGRSVQDVLFKASEEKNIWDSHFGYSMRLVLLASFFAVGLGIPLGILSAVRPKSTASRAIMVGLAALVSIPSFVLGLLAVIVLALWLKLITVLPDWNHPEHWIVAAVMLAVMPMANIARVTRTALMHVLQDEYIRTAHAKGLSQARVLLVHALRNALVPVITFLGPTLLEIFTGLFVVENLYSFPGLGRQYFVAVLALDYPMVLGLTLVYAAGFVLVNGLVEVVCELLDPRLRAIQQPGAP